LNLAAALLALSCAWPAATAQDESVVQIKARPTGQVSDSSGWLSPADAEALSQRLRRLRKDDKIDIIVVILPAPPSVRPDVFAGQMLSRWGEGDTQTLILHVVGDPDGPWMVAGGRTVRLAGELVTREAILEARRHVEATRSERDRLFVAVNEMEDLLHFLSYRGRYHEERLRAVLVSHQLNVTKRRLNQRVLIVGSVATSGLLLLGVVMGAVYWTRFRSPLWFPATSWRLRLGAPYAGGNDAAIRLDPQDRRN